MQAQQLLFSVFVKKKDFIPELSFTTLYGSSTTFFCVFVRTKTLFQKWSFTILSEITINTQDVSPAPVILYVRICNQLIDM